MRVTFKACRCHFEVTLRISTSNFMCDACVMHTCTGLVGPKRGKVKKILVFKAFLKGSKEPRVIQDRLQGSEPEHFLVTLGSIFGVRGCFWITLGSLRDYCAVALGT